MGCQCGGGTTRTSHEVWLPNGTIRSYLTKAEAVAAAKNNGGTYTPVQR